MLFTVYVGYRVQATASLSVEAYHKLEESEQNGFKNHIKMPMSLTHACVTFLCVTNCNYAQRTKLSKTRNKPNKIKQTDCSRHDIHVLYLSRSRIGQPSQVQDCYFFQHSMTMYFAFFSRTMQQSCTLMGIACISTIPRLILNFSLT